MIHAAPVYTALVALATLLLPTSEPEHLTELSPLAGRWSTTYEDADGHNEEIWHLDWNPQRTHLVFCTETSINGELVFEGVGSFFPDGDGTYRLYLMMSNGVLHESVGMSTGLGEFRFDSTSYGLTAFPDHAVELSAANGTLTVTYVYPEDDGGESRYEYVFERDPSPAS